MRRLPRLAHRVRSARDVVAHSAGVLGHAALGHAALGHAALGHAALGHAALGHAALGAAGADRRTRGECGRRTDLAAG